MIQKDWKTYHTMEEAIEISNKEIRKNAKSFAKRVLAKQKELQSA